MDSRLTPANARVAALHLEGKVDSERFVEGELTQCGAAAVDILGRPNGRRTAQLLFGDMFEVLERHAGFAFGQAVYDGYCGYVREDLLVSPQIATHWVSAPSTHLYPGPNIKLMTQGAIYFGSEVTVISEDETWAQLSTSQHVPKSHLVPIGSRIDDPVAVADLFLGTPYLWGGSTRYGIDCSGLVQMAFRSCGMDCPRDSDMQEADLGEEVDLMAAQRGDLMFWKGHVAIVTSETMLLHANAYHMAVAYEPITDAISRIEQAGDGLVTAVKRVVI